MTMYLKGFIPIALALTVGCASNHDSNTAFEIKNETPKETPSVVREASDIKDEFYDASQVPVAEKVSKEIAFNSKHKPHKRQSDTRLARLISPKQPIISDTFQYFQNNERENYASVEQNAVKSVLSEPVSTFSIDVDTGSYTNIRRLLNQGHLPPEDAVRIEEMINYFDYAYEAPESIDQPFNVNTEIAQAPWSKDHVLLKVGLKGFEVLEENRPEANLVFLLDVSGSMNSSQKLPLLKKSLVMLSKQLTSKDKVSIVVYAGASGIVLEPTPGNQVLKIEQALDKLSAGGSTNGQSGIQLAYQLAKRAYNSEGINRVILATDGDFNVGTSDVQALKNLIAQKRKDGISLTTLGFGSGNYNDELMEQLADVGNGNYAYIDGLNEARKVLVETLSSTLFTIAKDVKIQIEFNPHVVKEYRLLGYENRALKREDFNNDKVDAGDIGAGHTVTALYELVLQSNNASRFDPLRYQTKDTAGHSKQNHNSDELAFVKFRYKDVDSTKSKLMSRPIANPKQIMTFDGASNDFRFSATVAEFGEVLRQSKYLETVDYTSMIQHALNAKGTDTFGYRSEFVQLLRLASNL